MRKLGIKYWSVLLLPLSCLENSGKSQTFAIRDDKIASVSWQGGTLAIRGESTSKATFFLDPLFRALPAANGARSIRTGKQLKITFQIKDGELIREATRTINAVFKANPMHKTSFHSAGAGDVIESNFVDLPFDYIHLDLSNLGSRTPKTVRLSSSGRGALVLKDEKLDVTWEFSTEADASFAHLAIESGDVQLKINAAISGASVETTSVKITTTMLKSLDLSNNVGNVGTMSNTIDSKGQFFSLNQVASILTKTLDKTTIEIGRDKPTLTSFITDRGFISELLAQFIKETSEEVLVESLPGMDSMFIGKESFTPDTIKKLRTEFAKKVTDLLCRKPRFSRTFLPADELQPAWEL